MKRNMLVVLIIIISIITSCAGCDSKGSREKIINKDSVTISDNILFKDIERIVSSVNAFKVMDRIHYLDKYELNPDFGFGYTSDLNVLYVDVSDSFMTDRSIYSEIDILMYLSEYLSKHQFEKRIDGIEYRYTQVSFAPRNPWVKYMSCKEYEELCKDVRLDENEALDNKIKKLSEYYISSTSYKRNPGFETVDKYKRGSTVIGTLIANFIVDITAKTK